MPENNDTRTPTLLRDLIAVLVVFLVALPLCLGVALASNAPLFSGLLAGIIGGLVVGILSGSHSSVAGPAAGLTAVVAAQLAQLGSFQAFLLALVVAGVVQMGLGIARLGFIAAFFPSSVIKGLLAAIGVILILKQLPHVFGHDTDPEGEMAFDQPDHENTFTEFYAMLQDMHPGAAVIGLVSIGLLLFWDRYKPLKKSVVPAPLVVVMLGVALAQLFQRLGPGWAIETSHLVEVPVAANLPGFLDFLQWPDFSQWRNPAIYGAGVTIAIVASLETLLNLEAVDKLDPKKRSSPASRELVAQGVGNLVAGLIGGIPVTSVIVRSSVNINAGAQTKLATIVHGTLLLTSVVLLPSYLNMIPLSCLAAILLVTGIKLVSPALIKQMWQEGRYQFVPFVVTVVAIVLTDLVNGILIGLGVALSFILHSNLRRPVRVIHEKHLGGEVVHVELASQVSFLNRAALERVLLAVPRGGQLLIDAHNTAYIDPDILELIREFRDEIAPARDIKVSTLGFRTKYQVQDQIQFVDFCSRDVQSRITPMQVLQLFMDGNERFRTGRRLTRDLGRQVQSTADGQHPLAVVLSCIDSRAPVEMIFDLGLGEVFSIRIAGNIVSRKVLGSMEYACTVAGAKLLLVLGHTRCGAITAAVDLACTSASAAQVTGCQHLEHIIGAIQESMDDAVCQRIAGVPAETRLAEIDRVAQHNVFHTVDTILKQSDTLRALVHSGKIAVAAGMYDVATGEVQVLSTASDDHAAGNGNRAAPDVRALPS
jgi:carbonic anhydrase